VILFVSLLAIASARLDEAPRRQLALLFEGLAGALIVVIGWVLMLAPIGVFALALAVGAKSGAAAAGALVHYILVVAAAGVVVMLGAYAVAALAARQGLGAFARAVLPAQAVALSTQSSLASLPAMLASCRKLGLRQSSADFVLPLAVTLLRATSPAMNLAVVIYVAKLTGTELSAITMAVGVAVAMVMALSSPSLPGTISFVTSIGPIALAMGVPLEPLALLVAVEMLPDIMRTVGNVTMDVAVTAVVDRGESGKSSPPFPASSP
jgi:proton glutamate symport protein